MQREIAYDPVFDAQSHYRLLLDSMARPGKINQLPRLQLSIPDGTVLTGAGALAGFALLNADVSYFVDGAGADLATRYLLVNTSARSAEVEEADFVFSSGSTSGVLVEAMKKGTLSYPEEGATLVASVEALAVDAEGLGSAVIGHGPVAAGDRLALTLKGPGVPGEKTFFVRGLNVELISALQQSNIEFPLGVDLILADGGGRLAAIPRSSQIRWEIISI